MTLSNSKIRMIMTILDAYKFKYIRSMPSRYNFTYKNCLGHEVVMTLSTIQVFNSTPESILKRKVELLKRCLPHG
jgi:hypothetical protein